MKNLFFLLFTVLFLNTLHSQTNNVKNILEEYNYSTDSFFVGGTLTKFQLNTEVENIFLKELRISGNQD